MHLACSFTAKRKMTIDEKGRFEANQRFPHLLTILHVKTRPKVLAKYNEYCKCKRAGLWACVWLASLNHLQLLFLSNALINLSYSSSRCSTHDWHCCISTSSSTWFVNDLFTPVSLFFSFVNNQQKRIAMIQPTKYSIGANATLSPVLIPPWSYCSPAKLQLRLLLLTGRLILLLIATYPPASWPNGNMFVSGSVGLRFKSWAGQIGHNVVNSLPPLQHFFQRSCVARAQWRGDVSCKLANTLRCSSLQRVWRKLWFATFSSWLECVNNKCVKKLQLNFVSTVFKNTLHFFYHIKIVFKKRSGAEN